MSVLKNKSKRWVQYLILFVIIFFGFTIGIKQLQTGHFFFGLFLISISVVTLFIFVKTSHIKV